MKHPSDAPAPAAPQQDGGAPITPPPTPAAPPAGTYPQQGPWQSAPLPQPWPAQPQPKGKTRRVGTFTMALCLIALGVILLLRLVLPQIDLIWVARLSPVVLILLGIEMLVANLRFKEEKLRYDGLSIFISLVLIACSLVAAVVPELIFREIESERVANRLAAQLEDTTGRALRAEEGLENARVQWYINLSYASFTSDMTPAELSAEHYVQARVFLQSEYESKEAFVAACRHAANVLMREVSRIDYASFYSSQDDGSYRGDVRYNLWASSWYEVEELIRTPGAANVDAEYWYAEGGYYISEWEFEDRLNNPQNYGGDYAPADDDSWDDGQDVSDVTDDAPGDDGGVSPSDTSLPAAA